MDYDYISQSLAALAGVPVRLYKDGTFERLYHHIKFKPDLAIIEEPNIFHSQGNVSYYMDENFLYYGLLRSVKDHVSLVIGPVSQVIVDRTIAIKILRTMGESIGRADELVNYFSSMPTLPLRNFLQILCTTNYFLNGEKLDVGQLLFSEEHTVVFSSGIPVLEPPRIAHNTDELEALMLSCVEDSDGNKIGAFVSVWRCLAGKGLLFGAAPSIVSTRSFRRMGRNMGQGMKKFCDPLTIYWREPTAPNGGVL